MIAPGKLSLRPNGQDLRFESRIQALIFLPACPLCGVPQYVGVHSHILGYSSICECSPCRQGYPNIWDCISTYWGTPVYGRASLYTRVPHYMEDVRCNMNADKVMDTLGPLEFKAKIIILVFCCKCSKTLRNQPGIVFAIIGTTCSFSSCLKLLKHLKQTTHVLQYSWDECR
jgi:hypothetical protein